MIRLDTTKKHEVVNITHEVMDVVRKSGVQEGVCFIQSLHTTAGVYINVTERLEQDVLDFLEKLAPHDGSYRHNSVDPNAEAHLKKLLLGRSVTVAIANGQLVLGTWEQIQFVEFDGPRNRNVFVKILSG